MRRSESFSFSAKAPLFSGTCLQMRFGVHQCAQLDLYNNFLFSLQVELVLKFLKDYEINSYEQEIVIQEREEIDVVYTSDA